MTYQLHSHTITLDGALRDIESQNPRVRAKAAHALADLLGPEERARAVPALIGALDDPDPDVRSQAALALGDLETQAAIEPLVARIDDRTPVVRQSALVALGRLGFSTSFEAVASALESGPPDVRFEAATALAEIDPERSQPYLVRALDDADGEVVGAAALSLGAIGADDAADALARTSEKWTREATRFDIAYALADLGDERAIDELSAFVDHAEFAWDAVEALARMGNARAIPALSRAMGSASVKKPVHLRAAAALLDLVAQHDPPEPPERAVAIARKRLLTGLRARKRELRGLAVQSLEQVGGPWAVDALRALRSRRNGRWQREEIDAALHAIAARGAND